MKRYKLTIFLFLVTCLSYGQSKRDNWNNVQVFEFTEKDVPDSLLICGGEWFIKAEANNISELDNLELERIKKTVAEHGCDIVFVDVRKIIGSRVGQLYILGLNRKK